MAGDWIKVELSTPDKPEVVSLAEQLGIDQDAAFGKCVRLWMWADSQTEDGYALSVTETFIDRITFCTGFALALLSVGWIEKRDGKFTIPNFDRHNGKSAKSRANALNRMRLQRERDAASVTDSVTPASPEKEVEIERDSIKQKNNNDLAQSPFLQDGGFAVAFGRFCESSRANHNWTIAESTKEAWLMQLHDLGLADAILALDFSTAAGAKKPIVNGDHRAKPKEKQTRRGYETGAEKYERMFGK